MLIDFSAYSHIGRRQNNEDALCDLQIPGGFLAVVADGLGGHRNGEFASQQAVETLRRYLDRRLPLSEDLMEEAVIQANEDVFSIQNRWPEAKTTVAVLWLQGNTAVAANVGDSRVYQFRGGKIIYQSVDHSLAQLAVVAGKISAQQIRSYPERNKLTRSLGWEETPWVDIRTLSVQPGDRFLLCSDGFWEELTEDRMLELVAEHSDAESWLQAMRVLVQPRASDNNTAVAAVVFPE